MSTNNANFFNKYCKIIIFYFYNNEKLANNKNVEENV